MAKKKDKKTDKTNAVRLVETAGIEYVLREQDISKGFLGGVEMAKMLNQNPKQVFKTLVTVSSSGEHFVCVIPVDRELNLKKAARHFGVKKVEMLLSRKLLETTGYVHGGCSPVGMKKLFPTVIDDSAADFETIMVSAGKVGLQMELKVGDLLEITRAAMDNVTDEIDGI
ncbi:MAG: Cys-tRNA(Pro) deacylase [Lentihominibacter sp.]|nr:Cys-tRNA(Pro) deacylase [Lentihominibacter sp.]